MPPRLFKLDVQQVDQTCLFKLSWGQGQQLAASLTYPIALTHLYQDWQRSYRNFYRHLPVHPIHPAAPAGDSLRGRVLKSDEMQLPPPDWQIQLVQTEANLLHEFHRWLRSAELFEIRKTIAQASQQVAELAAVEVFLTCHPLELARFPWEVWEISTEFAATGSVRMVRTPMTIRSDAAEHLPPRRRPRILTILGDETGLDFQADREAVRSLTRMAEVQFVGWQPGQSAAEVKLRISEAIADPQGWDALFFAGHSNEAQMVGGELAIAPNAAIAIREIAPQLSAARQRGLQFALFNSCNGLNIAESLIDLGFSQVVVMREPVHNRVAQAFLVEFLQTLARYGDVQDALLAASQMLKLEKNLTYPSAYLIPSLFCHPGAALFRIPRSQPRWKQVLSQLLPTRAEAAAIAVASLVFSPLLPVQEPLLDQRVAMQAVWRDLTQQVPAAAPPITVVHVDSTSIARQAELAQPYPLNQAYLAALIDRLAAAQAPVIGIDYLLDRSDSRSSRHTQQLRRSLQTATQRGTTVVFATLFDQFDDPGIFTTENANIAERHWTMQGYASFLTSYLTLPYPNEDCTRTCPFAYLLALTQTAKQAGLTPPRLSDPQTDLRSHWVQQIDRQPAEANPAAVLRQTHLSAVAAWLYETIGISWFKPIIDYSIPPDRVYRRVSAWRLQEDAQLTLPQLSQQIALIGAGDYTDAGSKVADQLDLYPVPAAVQYWRDRLPPDNPAGRFRSGNSENALPYLPQLTGVEVHAYIAHHLLNQRLVMPIPDVLLMLVALFAGRSLAKRVRQPNRQDRRRLIWIAIAAPLLYGLMGLQLYIAADMLLPWLLPSLALWGYALSTFWRKNQ